MNKTTKRAIVASVILLAILYGVDYAIGYNKVQEYVAQEQVVVLDNRDNIQKLSDNFAQSYRDLVQAEQEHAEALAKLDEATERYNESASYLETFTK